MKRTLAAVAAVLAATACGSTSAVSLHGSDTSPSPSVTPSTVVSPIAGAGSGAPSPTASNPEAIPRYAVLVDNASSTDNYRVSLVGDDGQVLQQFTAVQRTPLSTQEGKALELPYVSTTLDGLYWLDAGSQLVVWRPGLSATVVRDLGVPSGSEAAFAVSPDDLTVAVSVLDYAVAPVHETLYTDAVGGGRKHVIFQSTSDYVWPVAWHSGLLVLAHAYGPYEESIAQAAPARDNPYSAISYHLVDPANAVRKVLMGACTVSGPLSPAGSGCIQGGSIDWKGNTTDWSTEDWGTRSSAASLSPDGQWMAAENPNDPSQMGIWRRSDGLMSNWVNGPGLHDWAGWLDSETILVGSEGQDWQPIVVNVIAGGVVHPVAAHGFFAGVFPTNLV